MERKYYAAAYIIDCENKCVLLKFYSKRNKWDLISCQIDGLECPWDTVVREAEERLGVSIKLVGTTYDDEKIEPVSLGYYEQNGENIIEIQYLAIPITKEIKNNYENEYIWYPIDSLKNNKEVDSDLERKINKLVSQYLLNKI